MKKIKNYKYDYFNPKNITLNGWIKHQLQTQLDGLTGNLCNFWPDISDSSWIGGTHDSWERVPYWLDGYIPLVYLLNDKKGIKTAKFYVENIIKRQQEDGWIAPSNVDRATYDVWGIFIILKSLLGYAEITNKKYIYDSIYKALKALDKHLDTYPLYNWAKFRWFEALIVIYPIYKMYKEEWLIALANKLHDQGFDYYSYYLSDFPKKRCKTGEWNYHTHGVNNAMAIKCYALYGLLTQNKEDLKKSEVMLKKINKYHGNVIGTINADECLAGKDPRQGSELCLIVELMYSLENLGRITGKTTYLAQLERLAFNALPNAISSDMWSHQYDTQVNAPFIKRNDVKIWTNNGPESNIYGLEPHYGCCTSNYHQGWPKFVLSSVAHHGKIIFINNYLPLEIKNKNYSIKIETAYPFKNSAKVRINSIVNTKIHLNIPSQFDSVLLNGFKYTKKGYLTLDIEKGENIFDLEFINKPKFEKNYKGYSLVDGSLIYALKIDEKIVQINQDQEFKELPHGDFEYHNLSKFNYGLSNFEYRKENHDVDLDFSPFVNKNYPTSYYLNCVEIDYKIKGNYVIEKNKAISTPYEKEFIPIGINKLHIGTLKIVGEKND